MKEITCCFTGHRTKDMPKDTNDLEQKLRLAINNLIYRGVTNFIAGGALGFDTLAAFEIINIRQKNRKLKLSLYLPCRGQEKYWNNSDKEMYKFICAQADEVVYISEEYFPGCMQKRNNAMVTDSAHCIAYLTKKEGGTFYTVKYAKFKKIDVINLA